jgi:hypothetical protein
MKQSASERARELKKHLGSRPSMCKHCKSRADSRNMEYICGRTERHTFFGTKADKCHGDCGLYEKSFPEMLEDTIYGILKGQIEKLKADSANNETEGNAELFESGYLQCQKDVLEIIEKMSNIRRNKT